MPSEPSGAMEPQAGRVRALACVSEGPLMDEALSAVDPSIRRRMQDKMGRVETLIDDFEREVFS